MEITVVIICSDGHANVTDVSGDRGLATLSGGDGDRGIRDLARDPGPSNALVCRDHVLCHVHGLFLYRDLYHLS